ncbi:zinc finger MYND domain-containing protein [Phanerochaete sordida]|uniref:Zinc finger MYND domain-containing protein n=1 Tax=Phanerochaete sordida TaxID=48140 RepID=A0A9P3GQZ1_9APHY|nr:zinc finger MYND domain-containing protein [Phanerochaete sordida]
MLLAYTNGFPHITTLTLRAYTFHDLGMLLRLVGSFRVIETLHCDAISWAQEQSPQATERDFRRLPRIRSPTLRTVTFTSSHDPVAESVHLLWLFGDTVDLPRRQRDGLLSIEEIPLLVRLARFVLEWRKEDRYMQHSFVPPDAQYIVFEADKEFRQLTVNKRLLFPDGMRCQMTSALVIYSDPAEHRRVSLLRITRSELLLPDPTSPALADFYSMLSKLPLLTTIEYEFSRPRSPQSEARFICLERRPPELSISRLRIAFAESRNIDMAAYLGSLAYIVSSDETCASFIQMYNDERSAGYSRSIRAIFTEAGVSTLRRQARPGFADTAFHKMSRAVHSSLSPFLATVFQNDVPPDILGLLMMVLRSSSYLTTLEALDARSREGFERLSNSVAAWSSISRLPHPPTTHVLEYCLERLRRWGITGLGPRLAPSIEDLLLQELDAHDQLLTLPPVSQATFWYSEHSCIVNFLLYNALQRWRRITQKGSGASQLCFQGTCNKNIPFGKEIRCSRCRITTYCSRECQTRAWDAGHKMTCIPHRGLAEGKDGTIQEPVAGTTEYAQLEFGRKVNDWLGHWRGVLFKWALVSLDLANYPDHASTHCVMIGMTENDVPHSDRLRDFVVTAGTVVSFDKLPKNTFTMEGVRDGRTSSTPDVHEVYKRWAAYYGMRRHIWTCGDGMIDETVQ